MLLSTCLVLILLNHSLLVTCAQLLSEIACHIFPKIGYQTVKVNHLGDWGKQFGMLIVAYKKWGDEDAVKAHPIDELLKLYVRIKR